MRWLSRPISLLRRRLCGERGAVTATVAIVVGGGVLLGMSAVVVDVGRLYAEREQLQSGADSVAIAVAERCVREPDTCYDVFDELSAKAGQNAQDGHAAVSLMCGEGPGLDVCPPLTGDENLAACLGERPEEYNYVEVQTATRDADDNRLLPATFSRAVLPDYDGTEVGACARVSWGSPRSGNSLAVTFSECEYNDLTLADLDGDGEGDDGAERELWDTRAEPTAEDRVERVIYLKGGGDSRIAAPLMGGEPAGSGGGLIPAAFGPLAHHKPDHQPTTAPPTTAPPTTAPPTTAPPTTAPPTTAPPTSPPPGGDDDDPLDCGIRDNGWSDAPGSFGWIDDDPEGSCTKDITMGVQYSADTGNDVPRGCEEVLETLQEERRPTLIPVYSSVTGTGSNVRYTPGGFAAFVLTGYDLGNTNSPSWLSGTSTCPTDNSGNSSRCLFGYFTRYAATSGAELGEPNDYGTSIINVVG